MSVIEKLDSVLALAAEATRGPLVAVNGEVCPAPDSPDRITMAYCSGEGSQQGEADAKAIAATINFLRDHGPAIRQDMIDAERWQPVDGYEGEYEVSTIGRVRSLTRIDSDGNRRVGQVMVPYRKGKGYVAVALCRGGSCVERYVHRLVASAFIKNPGELPQVNHIDGDPANNAASNLEWVTNAENQIHSRRVLARGVRAVFGIADADGARLDFPSLQHAVEAGFVRSNIQKCIAGDRKRHRGYRWFDAAIDAQLASDSEGRE